MFGYRPRMPAWRSKTSQNTAQHLDTNRTRKHYILWSLETSRWVAKQRVAHRQLCTVLSAGAVDEDRHYSFAVALRCRSPPHVPTGKAAIAFDLALRPAGDCFPICGTAVSIPYKAG